MVLLKESSHPFLPRKRPIHDADDCELEEVRKPKMAVKKYPPPNLKKIGVHFDRDFPPGCGIVQDSTGSKADRKPFKKLDNVDSSITKMTSMVDSEPFENNNLRSFKPKELGTNKPSFASKPSSKVKFWDPKEQIVHDFPPVCGNIEGTQPEKKPLKKSDNVDSNIKKMKLVNSHPFETNKVKTSFTSRPVSGKVQFWDPTCSKEGGKDKDPTTIVVSQKEKVRREKIHEAMNLFNQIYPRLFQENGSKPKGEKIAHWRVTMEAANLVKRNLNWMNPIKTFGSILGIQPGDKFKFRSQLQMVGLHSQPHCGIDYIKINGNNIAISIVDSHRYSNEYESCDVISYSGEGGSRLFGYNRSLPPEDQKLERGNLALKNSMNEKTEIRVIRKVLGNGKNNEVFVYEGLYTVKDCTQKRSSEGKMVFMFDLHKVPGQLQNHKPLHAYI